MDDRPPAGRLAVSESGSRTSPAAMARGHGVRAGDQYVLAIQPHRPPRVIRPRRLPA